MKRLSTIALSVCIASVIPPKAFSETVKRCSFEPQNLAASDVDYTLLSYQMGLIIRKIRNNLNSGLCPVSNPEFLVEIRLTENGELTEIPKFIASSNNFGCDEAVLKAILTSKPFDMPHDHPKELKMMTEPIRLKLRPRS